MPRAIARQKPRNSAGATRSKRQHGVDVEPSQVRTGTNKDNEFTTETTHKIVPGAADATTTTAAADAAAATTSNKHVKGKAQLRDMDAGEEENDALKAELAALDAEYADILAEHAALSAEDFALTSSVQALKGRWRIAYEILSRSMRKQERLTAAVAAFKKRRGALEEEEAALERSRRDFRERKHKWTIEVQRSNKRIVGVLAKMGRFRLHLDAAGNLCTCVTYDCHIYDVAGGVRGIQEKTCTEPNRKRARRTAVSESEIHAKSK